MAAAARSFWKGYLRLALVTIPVRLVSAASSEAAVHLHQVDRKTKQRIRYQKVTSESGVVVKQDDIVSGVEVEPGKYVLIDEAEIAALKLESRHTIELLEFVDAGEIEALYFERPYYVLPDGEMAEEGYRVIRDALRATGKCGVGQLTMRGRENLIALMPAGDGLAVITLRYENELKDAHKVFSDIGHGQSKPELVAMAKKLIEERSSDFDAHEYRDHYAEALREMVKSKQQGGDAVAVAGSRDNEPSATVIDFMEALKKSVAKSGAKAEPAGKSKRTADKPSKAAAASARREPVKRSSAYGSAAKKKSRKH